MTRPPSYLISALLERDANNLDLIRLLCACLVIYGHAFSLGPNPAYALGDWDPLLRLGYPGVYSASVAVKVFFFISGLLITNSLLAKRSVSHFVIARIFRIWPALIVVLLATAFLIGPWMTSLDLSDYFSRHSVYRYVVGNSFLWLQGNLPGVFIDNPTPGLVNGSLWTLSYEAAAYGAVLILALLGAIRYRWLCAILLLLVVVDPVLPAPLLGRWLNPNPQCIYLPTCFAAGALLAVFKDRLSVSPILLLIAALLFWLLHKTSFGPLALFLSVCLTLLYVSALPWLVRIRPGSDLSYGTYLWGYPIQQVLAEKFAEMNFWVNLVISLGLALFLGFLSWHLIERPAIQLGRRIAAWWTRSPPRVGTYPALGSGDILP
jgi:peptidoglycan/LPS O-acetylase OafA/YrhL